MYSHIKLSDQNADEYIISGEIDSAIISNLKRINIFVGPNNSGKSRLVRKILFDNSKRAPSSSYKIKEKGEELFLKKDETKTWLESWQSNSLTSDTRKDKCNLMLESLFANNFFLYEEENLAPFDYLLNLGLNQKHHSEKEDPLNEANFLHFLQKSVNRVNARDFLEFPNKEKNASPLEKIYIPSTRGLRPLLQSSQLLKSLAPERKSGKLIEENTVTSPLSEYLRFLFGETPTVSLTSFFDLYAEATYRDYNELSKSGVKVFSGLTIYDDIKRLLLGTQEERGRVKKFEQFLRENFFEGQPVELTPNINSQNILYVRTGKNGKDRPIHDLGDGIQSIITLLYPIHTQLEETKEYLIGIEEPELHLHPGLQKQLINSLESIENAQFFISTHSNHILDSILTDRNTSLYRVRKDYLNEDPSIQNLTRIEPVRRTRRTLLSDLGILNTSVFLSNCTIWVEGITDRMLFKHFLEIFLRAKHRDAPRLIEGRHYSFVEYGGANLTHWDFSDTSEEAIDVQTLCGEGLLVVDGDNATGAKEQNHERLQNTLGQRFIRLNCKELENLLSEETLGKIVSDYGDSQTKFTLDTSWEKYRFEALGSFLDRKIKESNYQLKRKRSFCEGNTIRDKVKFVKKAIEHTNDLNSMSKEAIRVTTEIYDFIKKQNS